MNMSINMFETQEMYYHTLDERNCDSHMYVVQQNGQFFLFFFSKLGVTFRCS